MATMSAERWRTIDAVVDGALDLAPPQRAAFVARMCAGDAVLRAEVERLLQSCDAADGFLDEPAARYAAALIAERAPAGEPIGSRVGPYRIVAEAGHGGMGAVYEAERDDDQYRQRVALKLVRRGLDGDTAVLRRFVAERQMLASLEHPNIARLLDGGVTPEGLPYFAMEYVVGTPIDRYCDSRTLPIRQRLQLFCTVCDAVHYAHRQLLVHRDLKPANILVTDGGDVKLLDFGIAEPVAPGAAPGGPQGVAADARLMTPAYASPEQVRGEAISTSSDVYSLGVLLHELLTGRRPHRPAVRAGPERDTPPSDVALPSATITPDSDGVAAAVARSSTPSGLRRALRGDLDAIMLLAIRLQPEGRYASAERLGADIRRHLDGLPVSARPDIWHYRAAAFVRRHRIGVAAAATFVLLLAGSSLATLHQSVGLRRERDKAEAVSQFLVNLFTTSNPYANAGGGGVTARMLLDSGAARIQHELAAQPDVQAQLMGTMGRAYYGLGLFDQSRAQLEGAIALRRRLVGDADPSVLAGLNQLALVRLDAGEPVAAESLYRDVLVRRRRLYGERHTAVARSLNGLALALLAQGRSVEAEPVVRQALAIDRTQPVALELGQSLNNLGRVLLDRREYAGAERALREAVAWRRSVLRDGTPEVDNALSNLGAVLALRGQRGDARDLLAGVVERQRRSLGSGHPDYAADAARYAGVLQADGNLAAAGALYDEALAVHRRTLRPSHPATARTLLGMGRLRLQQGDSAAAAPVLREALAIERRLLPVTHPRLLEAEQLYAAAMSASRRRR